MYELSLDPEMLRWVSLAAPYERSYAQFFVENIAIARARNGSAANFVIENAATDQQLGRIDLHRKPDRAAGGDSPPEGMGLRRILWHALVGNVGSLKVAERAGFTIQFLLRRS
ncbi:hypothetical protein [Streptomyces sp. NPDC001657]|uniref:GNAT family N-acetyltransferase n=1 Tax=Streptomyces sp. NPDC001657 TaxID=3154522 RepID=UPI0033287785